MTMLNATDICGGYATAELIVKGVDLTCRAEGTRGHHRPQRCRQVDAPEAARWSAPEAHRSGLDRWCYASARDALAACEHGVSFVPQERNVFGSLSVQENLEMGGYLLRSGVKGRIDGARVSRASPFSAEGFVIRPAISGWPTPGSRGRDRADDQSVRVAP